MKFIRKHRVLILLLLILALAFFFRFWRLDVTPPGLYPDEAMNGNNALEAMETGNYKVFYPENNGREGLFINLIALSFRVFGPHIWSIRLVSAIFGFLTVLGLYFLTKELFRTTNIALLSTFFLAISFWHTNFSRIGFRGIMVPFCLVWSFYFFLFSLRSESERSKDEAEQIENREPAEVIRRSETKAENEGGSSRFRKSKLISLVLAGVFFGIGFHTYISFRVAILILGVILLTEFLKYWKKNKPKKINWSWLWKKFYLKDGWWKWDLLILVIILVALPLGIYFMQNPESFMGRAGDVSIFNIEHPFKELGLSILKTLGMFNIYGDGNWRHNFSGSPQLLWPIGILFLMGLGVISKKLINSIRQKKFFSSNNVTCYVLCVIWFMVMLLPCFLSAEGVPHALRAIGVIPVVYIFAALGFYWLLGLHKYIAHKKIPLICCVSSIIFFIILACVQYDKYFIRWGRRPETQGAFTQKFVGIGNLLNTLEGDQLGLVIVNEGGTPIPIKPELTINYYEGKTIPMPAQTVMFITHKKSNIKFILPEDIEKIIIDNRRTVIFPMAPNEELFNQLKQKFPQGIREENAYKIY